MCYNIKFIKWDSLRKNCHVHFSFGSEYIHSPEITGGSFIS